MRIGCLQFDPVLGDVAGNIDRANALLGSSPTSLHNLDLLMLPELAFSGYNHPSLEAIRPYLEPTKSGPSTEWAIQTARNLGCHVSVGYPEITQEPSPVCYNSVVLVSPAGEVLVNYRKSFLYYTDETWAEEGKDGFFAGTIPGLGEVTMGICMDLNPYRFEAPWTAYEFATHALQNSSSLILMTMAWSTVVSGPRPLETTNEPDTLTFTYWLGRLRPLIEASHGHPEVLVTLCNRVGREGDALYAGTSAVWGIKNGRVTVYGELGWGQEAVLVVDTLEDIPRSQLAFAPPPSTWGQDRAGFDAVPQSRKGI
ncbi:MAG: Chitin synthase, class 3 [Watsoniomyces obsoletus]|nr:MAG: Chitin synthase, class 3 [Watsoniomyces obsoletus]